MINQKLITLSNPKMLKAQPLPHGEKYLTGIVHLSPFKISGRNVCANATTGKRGCVWSCLNTSGHGGIGEFKTNKVQLARIARTNLWFENASEFRKQFLREIGSMIRKAENSPEFQGVAIRPNGTSDLLNLALCLIEDVNREFPSANVMFYDYTKNPWDFSRGAWILPNYHLTFSWSGEFRNETQAHDALCEGVNVAGMIQETDSKAMAKLEALTTYRAEICGTTFNAVNFDKHDLRFLNLPDENGIGTVGLLSPKGKARKQNFPGFAGKVMGRRACFASTARIG